MQESVLALLLPHEVEFSTFSEISSCTNWNLWGERELAVCEPEAQGTCRRAERDAYFSQS